MGERFQKTNEEIAIEQDKAFFDSFGNARTQFYILGLLIKDNKNEEEVLEKIRSESLLHFSDYIQDQEGTIHESTLQAYKDLTDRYNLLVDEANKELKTATKTDKLIDIIDRAQQLSDERKKFIIRPDDVRISLSDASNIFGGINLLLKSKEDFKDKKPKIEEYKAQFITFKKYLENNGKKISSSMEKKYKLMIDKFDSLVSRARGIDSEHKLKKLSADVSVYIKSIYLIMNAEK